MPAPDLGGRDGFDECFLGVPVPLPTLPGASTTRLDYTHFSVLMHVGRRLAATTAVGIDGGSVVDVPRGRDVWRRDPRLPADGQTDAAVYADNPLDRGHLVRRRDPAWGSAEVAAAANTDTFYYPNCAPQAATFNQSKLLWNGLEDYLLAAATTYQRRIVVITGPVLAPDDPAYRDVLLPRLFYKVAAFIDDGSLASTAYLLDQSTLIDDLPALLAQAPPLGAYRTFQVPVADITALTGLELGDLPAADRYRVPPSALPTPPHISRWTEIVTYDDVILR